MSKICFLTGATSGIGEAGAIALAAQGYELFLTARSEEKSIITEQRIKSKTPDADITWFMGDLSVLSDVRAIAKQFLQTGKMIDLLWLNAGLCSNKRHVSADGFEMMLAVIHLAPFLLTNLLFENLSAGADETRIVVTASGAHKAVKALNLEDINQTENFKTFQAYGNSKLANILFTQSLAQKLNAAAPNKTFTVNCFHPGFVGTGIGTQITMGKVIMAMCRPFVRKNAKGAETGLFLALDSSVKGQSGGYYFDCATETLRPYARDMDMAQALWDKSEVMTGLKA